MNDFYPKKLSEKPYKERYTRNNLFSSKSIYLSGDDKKKRIYELTKSLLFPETGDVIDFGCGVGVFTEINKAKARYKNCIDNYLRNKAIDEWEKYNHEPNGSEMYLFYDRIAE